MDLTQPLRGKDFSEDALKQNPTTCCIKETHPKEIWKVKLKGQAKSHQAMYAKRKQESGISSSRHDGRTRDQIYSFTLNNFFKWLKYLKTVFRPWTTKNIKRVITQRRGSLKLPSQREFPGCGAEKGYPRKPRNLPSWEDKVQSPERPRGLDFVGQNTRDREAAQRFLEINEGSLSSEY